MSESSLKSWHVDLEDLLGLAIPPIAIAFVSYIPTGVRRIERALPPVTATAEPGRLRRAASSGSTIVLKPCVRPTRLRRSRHPGEGQKV